MPWSTRTFIGSLALGWGLFNLIEGVIDHHILQIHHVVEALGMSIWDGVFLGSGVILILVGLALICAGQGDTAVRGQPAAC